MTAKRSPRVSRNLGCLLVVLLAAGCMSSPSTGPSTAPTNQAASIQPASSSAPTPELPELNAWQAEVNNLQPDGTRSVESALTLFAMAFGPLPGVDAPTAEPGAVGSASPAVRAVIAMRDQLTDEQRAAIDGYLTSAENAATVEIPLPGASSETSRTGVQAMVGAVAQAVDPYERDLQQIGQQARRAAAPYFGEIPDAPNSPAISVRVMDSPDWQFVSFFVPTFLDGGFGCKVFVNRAHMTSIPDTNRSLTLDVIHCYQSWQIGSDQGFDGNVPAWAWEGPAEYIMLEALPVQEDDVLYWATYLLLPDVPLFERSYDAIGAYAQAFEAGVDMGAAFVGVLADVDNPERFALAGLASNAMLDKWASELLRTRFGDWGRDWEHLGPGLTSYQMKTALQPMSVSNGSEEVFSQDAYSNHLYSVSSTADIVMLQGFGRFRIGDGNVDSTGGGIYCTTAKGCGPCPDGSDPTVDPTRLSAQSVLAVSGGTDGTNGSISGHPLEEFCQKTPELCPDGPGTDAGSGPVALVGGSLPVAQADCTPEPTDDAFCDRYKAYWSWAQSAGEEITRENAAEIERRFLEMQPLAPPELAEYVNLMIVIYGTFARAPDPIQVPITGQLPLERIPEALRAMNAYCGLPSPF